MSRSIVPMLIILAVFIGCKEESTSPSSSVPSETVGTWRATSMVLTSTANSSLTFDAVAAGLQVTLTINSDGRYSFSQLATDGSSETDAGKVTFNGNQVTIDSDDPTEDNETITWSVANNVMTISGDMGHKYDFGNGEEDVTTVMTMAKQ